MKVLAKIRVAADEIKYDVEVEGPDVDAARVGDVVRSVSRAVADAAKMVQTEVFDAG